MRETDQVSTSSLQTRALTRVRKTSHHTVQSTHTRTEGPGACTCPSLQQLLTDRDIVAPPLLTQRGDGGAVSPCCTVPRPAHCETPISARSVRRLRHRGAGSCSRVKPFDLARAEAAAPSSRRCTSVVVTTGFVVF